MTYAFIWYHYCPKRHVHIHLALPRARQDLSAEGTSQPEARLLPPTGTHSLLIAKIEP